MPISIKCQEIRPFLGSDKPRMLFFPLINVKMPTIVGILTFMSNCWHFNIYEQENFHAQLIEHGKSFITSGPEAASTVQ